jgi:hypothetical protein
MASGTQELELFARQALLQGLDRESIAKALVDAGWTSEQARSAIDAFADIPFPVPVPRPRAQLSAREAFLYLVLFSTLYLSSYHLGSLLFDLINRAYPDTTVQTFDRSIADSMRWSVSYLIIAFPTFLFVAHYVGKDVSKRPVKRLSPIRRWLTYLTLFIATGVLIGDLATLVYSVLAGELSIRITLKVLVVVLIAGTVFGYYLSALRAEERE